MAPWKPTDPAQKARLDTLITPQKPASPEPTSNYLDLLPGSVWQHTNGNRYTIERLTNLPDEPRYPLTVVYVGANGMAWSRHASDWHRSMTLITAAPVPALLPPEGTNDGDFFLLYRGKTMFPASWSDGLWVGMDFKLAPSAAAEFEFRVYSKLPVGYQPPGFAGQGMQA